MRIAVYNQMFGLNGKSFWANVLGHWAVHYQSNPKKIWKRTNIKTTIDLVKRVNADIIGIIEVLEGQEEEIKKRLRKFGYKYFYLGKGHKTKYSNLHVIEMLASKIKGNQMKFKEWPVENHLGGGGGMVVCYFPKLKLNLVLIHLGLPTKRFFFQQIKHTKKVLKKLKGNMILMGDFNESYDNVKHHFPNLKLITGKIKTCSFTPFIRLFYCKDVDHIFVKGLKKKNVGFKQGRSDHKLIYADIK